MVRLLAESVRFERGPLWKRDHKNNDCHQQYADCRVSIKFESSVSKRFVRKVADKRAKRESEYKSEPKSKGRGKAIK